MGILEKTLLGVDGEEGGEVHKNILLVIWSAG